MVNMRAFSLLMMLAPGAVSGAFRENGEHLLDFERGGLGWGLGATIECLVASSRFGAVSERREVVRWLLPRNLSIDKIFEFDDASSTIVSSFVSKESYR